MCAKICLLVECVYGSVWGVCVTVCVHGSLCVWTVRCGLWAAVFLVQICSDQASTQAYRLLHTQIRTHTLTRILTHQHVQAVYGRH